MKSFFTILIVTCSGLTATAQKCDQFYLLQNGKSVTMTSYGRKDKMTGTVVYKVSDVKKTTEGLTAKINTQVFDDKQEGISTGEAQIFCNGGQYKMDLRMMLEQRQLKQMKNYNANVDFFVDYPAAMKVGDVLKDATFTLESKNKDGLNPDLEMTIEERTVLANESVTTTAGTWDCFKIKAHITIKTIIGGISIPFSTDITEWFAPGFGIIKSTTKSTRTELTALN